MRDEDLSKLLRLKRYEQPSPAYFENFLQEFHHRQRQQREQRSGWQRMKERLSDFWLELSVPQLAYAGASLAVLAVAGTLTVKMVQNPGATAMSIAASSIGGSRSVAAPAVAATTVASTVSAVAPEAPFSLKPQIRLPDAPMQHTAAANLGSTQPRYVLDTRPVSYEPPFRF
jgi:ABC-type Fe3+-siderophore transport system permease subunit